MLSPGQGSEVMVRPSSVGSLVTSPYQSRLTGATRGSGRVNRGRAEQQFVDGTTPTNSLATRPSRVDLLDWNPPVVKAKFAKRTDGDNKYIKVMSDKFDEQQRLERATFLDIQDQRRTVNHAQRKLGLGVKLRVDTDMSAQQKSSLRRLNEIAYGRVSHSSATALGVHRRQRALPDSRPWRVPPPPEAADATTQSIASVSQESLLSGSGDDRPSPLRNRLKIIESHKATAEEWKALNLKRNEVPSKNLLSRYSKRYQWETERSERELDLKERLVAEREQAARKADTLLAAMVETRHRAKECRRYQWEMEKREASRVQMLRAKSAEAAPQWMTSDRRPASALTMSLTASSLGLRSPSFGSPGQTRPVSRAGYEFDFRDQYGSSRDLPRPASRQELRGAGVSRYPLGLPLPLTPAPRESSCSSRTGLHSLS